MMENLPTSLESDLLLEATTTGSFVAVAERPPSKFVWSDNYEQDLDDPPPLIPDKSNRPGPPWLVGPREWGPEGPQHFEPLAVPDLHRRFAKLKDTPLGLLRFANRYGFLGLTTPVETTDAIDYDPGCFIAESAADWRYERRVMAHLLEIHDLVQRGAAGPLSKLVRWNAPEELGPCVSLAWPIDDPDGLRPIASTKRSPQVFGRWREGALVEPARYAVHNVVNGYIAGHLSPCLLPFERRGDIVFQADTLLAAMYMQFALEMSGWGRRAKLCRGCGTRYTPLRANQVYCDKNCRNRTYWQRKKSSEKSTS